MPNFKPKSKKKIRKFSKKNITLDNKHKEIIKEFENNKNIIIPKLLIDIKNIKKKMKNEKIEIEKKMDLQDLLNNKKKEVIKLKKKEKKYYLNNSQIIFDYFEKKKKLSEGNNKTKILHSFFDGKCKDKNNDKNINCVQQYMNNLDNSQINLNNYRVKYDKCKKCGGELIKVENMGVMVCNQCSQILPFLIENEKPSYKEPPKEVCFYAYKRINHFREILAQFQAKETTQIPDEVIEGIKNQIKKERMNINQLTNIKAKDILKKLGYNKYYEHIPFIKDKLGIKPPIMSSELEDILCNLFLDIQKPYSKNCPGDRVNFLNYYYVLYKMCELLDESSFLPFFPMLKDPVKRIEQDEIWKKICADLNWQFIPTI